jgi:hypothetical protein
VWVGLHRARGERLSWNQDHGHEEAGNRRVAERREADRAERARVAEDEPTPRVAGDVLLPRS